MFFILSKVLDFLISPVIWILFFMSISLFIFKNKEQKLKLMYAAFFLFLLFTNPFVTNLAVESWEVPAYSANQISESYDIGILLSGSMNNYSSSLERPAYSQSVDRLLQTISLYKTGKIKKILLTGGSGYVLQPEFKESLITKKVMIEAGIPAEDILVEDRSRNTYENAAFSARVLQEKNLGGKLLLITSAFHMRRSLACFNKAGLMVHPFPVDIKSTPFSFLPERWIIPDAYGLFLWKMLIREWIGVAAYKFQGYI